MSLDELRAEHIREEHDLEAELEAHVAHRVDELVAQGLPTEQAQERARRELGDAERIKAESRAVRDGARRRTVRGSGLDAFRQDFAHTFRQLRRAPGFALAALVTLAIGVGATTSIVSVVHAVVLAPLPFEQPERVVFAESLTPEGNRFSVSEADFVDWREEARSFESVAALTVRAATRRGPGEPRSIGVGSVSHELLDVLGLEPALGRMFDADEDRSGDEADVALLSHAAWRSEWAADPGVLGTTLDLDGRSVRVVGVMPPAVELLTGPAPLLFVPLGADPDADRGEHHLDVVARLAEGATFDGARAELAEVQRGIGQTHAANQGWSATIYQSRSELVGERTETAGWILLGAAGLLLLMACVNVSNLLLVRATARQAELSVRASLGASHGRLVRQLFVESVALSAFGGAAGVLLARLLLPIVRSMGEGRILRLDGAVLDGTALVACLASVAAASVVCGLAPALQLRSGSLAEAIGRSRRGSTDSGGRLRSVLVAGQVSITVVLLVGTGLLLRSFLELTAIDPGFEPEGTLAVRIDMPDPTYDWGQRGEIFPQIRQAVESLPGVRAAGATAVDPFSGGNLASFVARADRMPDRAADFTPIAWRTVTPGFFEAMGMELRAGRAFTESDDGGEEAPIVIGESLARALWDTADPIGQTVVWGDPSGSRLLVVGVVEDLRDVSLGDVPSPIVYRTHRQIPWPSMLLVVRAEGDPAAVAAGIRSRIREVVPDVPVPEIRSLEQNLRRAVAEPRFNLQILACFAVVGLLLAIVGVYGLTAFDVRRRFREIGIRVSLGADPRAIPSMILRERLRTTAVGVLVGLAVAAAVVRGVESQLYGISTHDPATWVGVVALIVVVSGLAAYVPARRATRVDPTAVLGAE